MVVVASMERSGFKLKAGFCLGFWGWGLGFRLLGLGFRV